MYYVLISFGFKSIFYADCVADAQSIARSIGEEKKLHAYLVYNRAGDLVYDYSDKRP